MQFIINEQQTEYNGNNTRKYTKLVTITGETDKAVKFTMVRTTQMRGNTTKTQRTEWIPKSAICIEGNLVTILNDRFDCKGMFY